MRSRVFLVGTAVLAALSLVSLAALATGHDEIAAGAVTLLVAAVGMFALASLMSQRRTARRLDRLWRTGEGERGAVAAPPAVREDDLVGMLRLVQAQYVGRLDNALDTLERATAHLTSSADSDGSAAPTHARLAVPPRDEYAPAVEAAIAAGIEVTVLVSLREDAAGWVERRGWQGRVVLGGRYES